MKDMVFTSKKGFNYKRVEKRTARKMHEAGREVHIFANNLRPFTDWTGEGAILRAEDDFEKFCNEYEWYNCDRYAGVYPSYYVFAPQSREERARHLFLRLNEAETAFGRKITDFSVFDAIRFGETATKCNTNMVIHMRQDAENENLYTLRLGFDMAYGTYLEKTFKDMELWQAWQKIREYMNLYNGLTGSELDMWEFDEEVLV